MLESQLKEVAPPRVAGAVGRFKDEELEDEVQHQPHKRLNVMCLPDLDMTCFWGNDANDLVGASGEEGGGMGRGIGGR